MCMCCVMRLVCICVCVCVCCVCVCVGRKRTGRGRRKVRAIGHRAHLPAVQLNDVTTRYLHRRERHISTQGTQAHALTTHTHTRIHDRHILTTQTHANTHIEDTHLIEEAGQLLAVIARTPAHHARQVVALTTNSEKRPAICLYVCGGMFVCL